MALECKEDVWFCGVRLDENPSCRGGRFDRESERMQAVPEVVPRLRPEVFRNGFEEILHAFAFEAFFSDLCEGDGGVGAGAKGLSVFSNGVAFTGSEAKGEGDASDEEQAEEGGDGFVPFDEQGCSAKETRLFGLGCKAVLERVDVGGEGLNGCVAFFRTEGEGLEGNGA